jgi:uncharacterized protein (DUF1330 family)
MPKAYVIAQADVIDKDAYALYVSGTALAFEKYGAKALARGGKLEIMEGRAHPRAVILEFESFELAKSYYHSDEYQSARQHRLGAADFNAFIIEGV